MAESEARDRVLVWVEDLHRRAGSKCFWEEEQKRTDLETYCLILSCSLWKVRPYLGNTAFLTSVIRKAWKIEHFNQSNSQVLYHQSIFQIQIHWL